MRIGVYARISEYFSLKIMVHGPIGGSSNMATKNNGKEKFGCVIFGFLETGLYFKSSDLLLFGGVRKGRTSTCMHTSRIAAAVMHVKEQ